MQDKTHLIPTALPHVVEIVPLTPHKACFPRHCSGHFCIRLADL